MNSTSAQGGNPFNYPTQSPSTIAKVKGHKMAQKFAPPVGGGIPPKHNIGAALMGLMPSNGPQNKMKAQNPIPSHNMPPTKLTMHSDQPGRMKPPASWKAKGGGRG